MSLDRPVQTGHVHATIPSRAIRAELMRGFVELANDEPAMRELFAPLNEDLPGSDGLDFQQAARDALVGMVRGDERRLRVGAHYPDADTPTPWISVVTTNGGEKPQETVAGDLLQQRWDKLGPDIAVFADDSTAEVDLDDGVPDNAVDVRFTPAIAHRVRGGSGTALVQIGCWHPAVEVAELLHAAVVRILFLGKGRLQAEGIYDLDLSWTGFEPDPKMHPRVLWVPIVQATVSFHMRFTERTGPHPTGVRVRAGKMSSGGSS